MGLASVARKRTLTHAPLLCSLTAVVAVLAGVLTGIAASFSQSQDDAVGAAVAQRPARSAAVQVSAAIERPAEGVAAQKVVDAIRGAASTDVAHAFRGDSFEADDGRRYVAATVPDLPDHAELTAGHWGRSDVETTVQADSGLAVGDTVSADGAAFKVVGTWRVKDPSDPRWFADPLGRGTWRSGPAHRQPYEPRAPAERHRRTVDDHPTYERLRSR